MSRISLKLLGLCAVLAAPAALASSITQYDFQGTVTSASGSFSNIAQGAAVTGFFAVDLASAPGDEVYNDVADGIYQAYNDTGAGGNVFSTDISVAGITYSTSANMSANPHMIDTSSVAALGQGNGLWEGSETLTSAAGDSLGSELLLLTSDGSDPFDDSSLLPVASDFANEFTEGSIYNGFSSALYFSVDEIVTVTTTPIVTPTPDPPATGTPPSSGSNSGDGSNTGSGSNGSNSGSGSGSSGSGANPGGSGGTSGTPLFGATHVPAPLSSGLLGLGLLLIGLVRRRGAPLRSYDA